MNRFILLAFAVLYSSGATAIADDYVLRLDTMGYVDKPATEKKPKERVLHSIEVVARPKSPFRGKLTIGTQTLSLAGELRPDDKGGFIARIRYVHSVELDGMVPDENGGWKPRIGTTAIQSSVAISVGEPVTVGGLDTQACNSGKAEVKSRTRCVLVLTKYEPTAE